MSKIPRPAVVFHYEIAGRFLSANFPDAATADFADRFLSALRASRVFDPSNFHAVPTTLNFFKGEWEIPAGLGPSVTSAEDGAKVSYYSSRDSYIVRIGDSTVAAGTEPTVNVALPEQLDPSSYLFERVLMHGVAAALRRAGAFELHCAAVTDPDTAISVLIVGPSGSGKSTLALQLAASGWNFSSDDVVLLTLADDRIEAFGLRDHFALTTETIKRSGLPGLDSVMGGHRVGADNKLPLPPQEFFPDQHVRKCVPEFLIFAQRTGNLRSRFEELDQTEAMKRLMKICPWACLDLPMARRFLDILGRLSQQCRAFDLYSGPDLVGNQHYTASFLSSIINQQAA